MKRFLYLVLCLWWCTACGNVATQTNDGPEPDPEGSDSPTEPQTFAVVHVTDFFSSALISAIGNLAAVTDDDISSNIVAPVPHTDAALRTFNNLLYIINRWGRDSIQVVDPTDSFDTFAEFSTGGGTNPQDIFVVSDSKAYVTLYQPEAVAGSQEVMVVHPETGATLKVIDLTGLTDNDGERLARPHQMIQIGQEVWVLLQDLDSAFLADTNGKIAVINTQTDALVDTDPDTPGIQGIALSGYNPNDIAFSAETGLAYITNTGVFGADFLTDTGDNLGGIEVVDPESYLSSGIVIDDADLGGYLGPVEIESAELGFTTADSKRVVSFDPTTFTVIDTNLYESPGTFLPAILLDGKGHLLVTERGDLNGQGAGLVILDIEDDFSVQGPLDVGGPPNALGVIELP